LNGIVGNRIESNRNEKELVDLEDGDDDGDDDDDDDEEEEEAEDEGE
jgi:hypothetical protein